MNEEVGIEECLRAIEDTVVELSVTAEVIVSDSSTDSTPDIGCEHGAIVAEPERSGYSYAYRCAFERTRGKYGFSDDADTRGRSVAD